MSGTQAFRSDLQALRGLAVLQVVLFHAWPGILPGGYVGVDVFFVISGYLITGLLVTELESRNRISFAAFYARRVRRLVPAACLVIATTMLAFSLAGSALDGRALVPAAIAATLYVSNIRYAWLSTEYLHDGPATDPLLHTWSLGVEEQFYLLWPALLLLAVRSMHRLPARAAVAWLLGGVAALSLAACIVATHVAQGWAFYSLPTRAWEFCVGGAGWLLRPAALRLPARLRSAASWVGLGAMAACGFLFSARTPFPGIAALLPVLGAFLVVTADGDELRRSIVDPLRWRWVQRLGDVSYSLYLWHWPVLLLASAHWPGWPPAYTAAAGGLASVALSALTWRFVENPLRTHPRLRERAGISLAAGATMLTTTLVVSTAAPRVTAANPGMVARQKAEFAIRDRPRLYDDRCFASALQVNPPDCLYGAQGDRPLVVLFGDSHAAQWFPALEELAKRHGFRLAVFVKAACPVALVEPFDPKLGRGYAECTQWRDAVFARIEESRPVLVVAGNTSRYDAFVHDDPSARLAWQQALDASIDRLAAAADHVALVRDTPLPSDHVPRCMAREAAARRDPLIGCSFATESPSATRAYAVERAAVDSRSGASLLDMNALVCPEDPCRIEQRGIVVFHDAQHLSASFARALADSLWNGLSPVVRNALTHQRRQ